MSKKIKATASANGSRVASMLDANRKLALIRAKVLKLKKSTEWTPRGLAYFVEGVARAVGVDM